MRRATSVYLIFVILGPGDSLFMGEGFCTQKKTIMEEKCCLVQHYFTVYLYSGIQ